MLKENFEESNQIIFFGPNPMSVIFNPVLSFPFEKIVGWINPEDPSNLRKKYLYHLSLKKIKEVETDKCLLVSNSPRKMTSKNLSKMGIVPKKIVYIAPDEINQHVMDLLEGKTVFLCGKSSEIKFLFNHIKIFGKCKGLKINKEVCFDDNYDFVILDSEHDRVTFSQRSSYRIDQILIPEFFFESGFFVKKVFSDLSLESKKDIVRF